MGAATAFGRIPSLCSLKAVQRRRRAGGPVLPDLVLGHLPLWLVTHRDLRHVPRVRAALDHLAEALGRYVKAA